MAGESNGGWGELERDSDRVLWDTYDRLPERGVNEPLDSFVERRHLTIPALVRAGARLADHTVIAFTYPGGIRYRDLITDRRWTSPGAEWSKLKIIPSGRERSPCLIVAEGESDSVRLSILYPGTDIAVLPGSKTMASRYGMDYAAQIAKAGYELVLVATDPDRAGDEAAAILTECLAVPVLRWLPPDCAEDWAAWPGEGPPPELPRDGCDGQKGISGNSRVEIDLGEVSRNGVLPATPVTRPKLGPAELAVLRGAHHSDAGNAERLEVLYGHVVRYAHDARRWHVYDGRAWAPDRHGMAARLARETIEAVHEAAKGAADEERAKLRKWALQSENATRIKAALEVAQSRPALAVVTADFDTDPWALNVRNGIVDLRTGELRPHDHAEMHSKVANAALTGSAACPQWEAFLERVLPDAEVRRFFQKAMGYSLTGDIGENIFLFPYGSGANGKTTALAVLRAVLGDYATEAPPGLLVARRGDDEHPTAIAGLRGYRFVTTQEIEEGQRMASGLLKRITGEPELTARKLYRDFETFPNVSKLWMAANDKPEVNGLDEAVWRRIRLLPFTVTIPEGERDPGLTSKLLAEADGILGWMVEGLRAYHAEGLAPPPAVRVATDEYREESNPLREWVEDACELEPDAVTPARELRDAYEAWAIRHRRKRVGANGNWSKALSGLGCTDERTRTGRRWLGIRLREPITEPGI